ncbi:MAG: deoxynucleoside kinase [Spirochaetaceae bacterium]|nr:deoxynucleoside kinase [Spirochaetaceae bacterium]
MIIVLEGLDCSGKSTQAKLISNQLTQLGINNKWLHFPSLDKDSAFAEATGNLLQGKFGKLSTLNPYLCALVFAANQFSEKDKLIDDKVIILDRYFYSNMAYQAANLPTPAEKEAFTLWLAKAMLSDFTMPKGDLIFYLNVPEQAHQKLLQQKIANKKNDIYEEEWQYQQQVKAEYSRLAKLYNFICVDCGEGENMAAPHLINQRLMPHILKKLE